MALIPSAKNSFLLLHLTLLLCTSTILNADQSPAEAPHSFHHHHPSTPSKPPAQPPSLPPARKLVAVRGVVYCKSCKYRGNDTLLGVGATPISGAAVKLQCNNSKIPMAEQTTTDKNGFFLIMPQKVTTMGFHKCKVFLVSSPLSTCGVPTNFHGGTAGSVLVPTPLPPPSSGNQTEPKFMLFSVGPFAFEPHKNLTCHS